MPRSSLFPLASRFSGGRPATPRLVAVGLLAVAAACLAVATAHAVTIDWVTVGDPGNVADPNEFNAAGFGAVAQSFRIMKFEFTNSQYATFLNTIDPRGLNQYSVYSGLMGDSRGGITMTGLSDGSRYVVKPNMGDKPVSNVSWFDAARVANWLHNGQGSGSTEMGAYTLAGQTAGTAPARNPGATFFIPTENEWYKAAYYKGGSTNAGYWDYPTQSDTAPTRVTAGSTGIGSAGDTGNFANFNGGAIWDDVWNHATTVGTNGGPSAYGGFDMGGNVTEWIDVNLGSSRAARGGDSSSPASLLSSSFRQPAPPSYETSWLGFRLASLPSLTVTGSQVYAAPVTGIVTTGGGTPQFNSGFTGSLTVTGGTATLGGPVAGTVTVGAGAAVTIASGASLTNAKVSLAPGAVLSVARGTYVPIAAGNIGGITVSTTTGLGVQVLAGTVAADTTIFATTTPKGSFSAAGGDSIIGDVLTFRGTGTATWVLQMQYNPATLPLNELTMASDGKLFLTWRDPGSDAWVNAVDGNIGGTKQLFQRAWQAGDALGSYGVDTTSNTVWAVINHNSDFAITAIPEPSTLALAAGGLACAAWAVRRRRRTSRRSRRAPAHCAATANSPSPAPRT